MTYTPRPGSAADRAIRFLRQFHPGTEVHSADVAVVARASTKVLHGLLRHATNSGALRTRIHRGKCLWSLGDAT